LVHEVLDRGVQAIARGGARRASLVLDRGAQADARGAAQVLDRGSEAATYGAAREASHTLGGSPIALQQQSWLSPEPCRRMTCSGPLAPLRRGAGSRK
jgi:hypothetical protein